MKFKLGNCTAIILVAVLLAFAGCSGKAEKVSTVNTGSVPQETGGTAQENTVNPVKEQTTENKNPNVNVENGEIGSVYKIKYTNTEYEITLKEAEFVKSDNAYFDKEYLMAFFEIKNTGDDTDFFTPSIYGEDPEKEKYDRTIPIGLSDKYGKILGFIKQLNPGQKTSGWVAIEKPAGTNIVLLYFEYTNPFLSDKPGYIKYPVTAGG